MCLVFMCLEMCLDFVCVAFPIFNFSPRVEGYDGHWVWRIKGEVA